MFEGGGRWSRVSSVSYPFAWLLFVSVFGRSTPSPIDAAMMCVKEEVAGHLCRPSPIAYADAWWLVCFEPMLGAKMFGGHVCVLSLLTCAW